MPTLDWIGKRAVVNHHREVPYRLIHCDKEKSVGDPDAGNLLVQGDNLEALKALLPYYAGKVKCIYIDPPYNTGNEGWVYNDNVNSPEMRTWLGNVVGKEAEDLSRHDKWLCMMYPRLRLLREFLTEDGVIFVSIDDNEFRHLSILLDEVFGRANRMATLTWRRRATPDSRNINGISEDHEYVLAYGRTNNSRLFGAQRDESKYTNPDNDPRGPWMSDNLTGLADATERPNLHHTVVHPQTGEKFEPHPNRGWAVSPDTMNRLITEERILWPKRPGGRPRIKRFLSEVKSAFTGFSSVLDAPTNEKGTRELNEIFGEKVFPFPKPSRLIQILLEQATIEGDLVLDSFAGSGTTGHAILRMEAAAARRFLLIEMDPKIATEVTAKRITWAIGTSGFRFCTLGEPLFDEFGVLNPNVTFADLAAHVFFCETGAPIPHRANPSTSLIGTFQGRAIHLFHAAASQGIASETAGNVLTVAELENLPLPEPGFTGTRVVYGDGCSVPDERLKAAGVVFKQIPYQLEGL